MIDQSTIDDACAVDLVELISSRGVDLCGGGDEFKGLCPFHSEHTASFTVNTQKRFYHCFGCGAHGDSIDFVMKLDDVPFQEAVQSIVGNVQTRGSAPNKKQIERHAPAEEWRQISPVPESAPGPMNTFRRRKGDDWEKLDASTHWAYLDVDGRLLGYVYRFNLPGDGKIVTPQSYCVSSQTGESRWKWLSFSKPRPIYGLNKLARHPKAQVIIVEGEKACDAAQRLFMAAGIPQEKLIVVSWPGGGKAVKYVNWISLHGRKIGLWPDADQKRNGDSHPKAGKLMPFLEQPGTVAMLDVFEHIKEQCDMVKFFLPPAAGVSDGWDLADDPPPGFSLLKHIKTHAMNAADVQKRFSFTSSISLDGTIRPVWLVPSTDPAETRRAEFAADVLAMRDQGIAQRIEPRGVMLRPYGDLDGLKEALSETQRLLPDAYLHVLIAPELGDEAVKIAEARGSSFEVIRSGESWVADLWAQAGMNESAPEDWDDDEPEEDAEITEQVLERAGRDEERRRMQQDENMRIQKIDAGAMIPSSLSVNGMIKHCIWIAEGMNVGYVTEDRSMFLRFGEFQAHTRESKTAVKVKRGEKSTEKMHPNADLWQGDKRRVSAMTATFHPGAPTITPNPKGLRAVNTWRPIKRWPAKADITPFIDQVAYLFQDAPEREVFLDWLAHIEQKPGELPHYGWLHIATKTGCGRNWVASVLARVFRGYVAPNVDLPALLDSPFNGQLGGRILGIVDEVREGAAEGNFRHAERLNQMVNAETRTINNKYGMMYLEFNALRWLVFSNHKNALPLSDTDRRFRVVLHVAPQRSPEVYARLYALLQDPEFINSVGVFLRERDISGFKPGERPPMNAAKLAAVAAAKPMSTQNAQEIVAWWPADVIINKHAAELLSGDPEKSDFSPAMRRAMEEAGAETWHQGSRLKIKIGSSAHRVWVLRNNAKWLAESTDAIRTEISRAGVDLINKPASVVLSDAAEGRKA